MAQELRWGIFSTGNIAAQFAEGLKISRTGRLVAVASRTLEKAQDFCQKHGGRPYGSYEELLADPEVDVVYIATPHHLHKRDTIACAKAGKGILCEKPFTLNLGEAREALAAVKQANVFFMEAFMYRCSPQSAKVREWIQSGLIGEVLTVHSEFAYPANENSDGFRNDNAVGGGCLMDVGTYCVSLSRMAFGAEPWDLLYRTLRNSKGVDWIGSGLMVFPTYRTATFTCGMGVQGRNSAVICGSKGRIEIDNPWKQRPGSKIRRYVGMELVETLDLSLENAQLYAYEADTVAEYFEAKECPFQTVADTLNQMEALDKLRASAGIKFDAEERRQMGV